MQSFKDNEGQIWNVALTIGKVRQLREKLGLDLLDGQHHLQVMNSLTDRLAFVFLLVEEQAKDKGLDADELEMRFYGDGVATEASICFLKELENFFQRLGQTVQSRLTKSSIEAMGKARSRLDEMLQNGKVDSLLAEATKEMEEMMAGNDGSGSSN